jgi:hypothetical protein
MLIATSNSATRWAGKTITFDDGVLTLEGHGLGHQGWPAFGWGRDLTRTASGAPRTFRAMGRPAQPAQRPHRVFTRKSSHEAAHRAFATQPS